MAATIGKLSAILSLNSAQFTKGMKAARKRLGKFSATVGPAIANVAKYGAAMAGVAVGGLALLTRQALKAIDATAKLSDRLGLSTEALTGLQHAANIMGASTETLNKGLRDMVRRIGEAKDGSGEAFDALNKLGLSAAELAEISADKAFATIADRLNKMTTAAEKADTAYGIFGRSGVDLLNTLSLGSAGLEDMRIEAEKLGITFGRVAAFEVEAANDAITNLKEVFRGVGIILAQKVSPFVKEFADQLTGAAVAGGGLDKAVSGAFETILRLIGKVLDGLEAMKAAWLSVKALFVSASLGIVTVLTNIGKGWVELLNLFGAKIDISNFKTTFAEIEQTIRGMIVEAAESIHKAHSGAASKKVEADIAEIRDRSEFRATRQSVGPGLVPMGATGIGIPIDALTFAINRLNSNLEPAN